MLVARYYYFLFWGFHPSPLSFQLRRGKLKVFLTSTGYSKQKHQCWISLQFWLEILGEGATNFLCSWERRLNLDESHHYGGWLMWALVSVGSGIRSNLGILLIWSSLCFCCCITSSWLTRKHICSIFRELQTHTHTHTL